MAKDRKKRTAAGTPKCRPLRPLALWALTVRTVRTLGFGKRARSVWAERPRTWKLRARDEAEAKVKLADLFEDPYWRADGFVVLKVRRSFCKGCEDD